MSSDSIDDVYKNGTYLNNNPTWFSVGSSWKAHAIFGLLDKNNIFPESVCEVGCGAGGVLASLSLLLRSVTRCCGYDISPQAIALCKEKYGDNIEFYCEDFTTSVNSGFDLILCADVFEHIEDYFSFLRNIKNRSKFKVFIIPLDLSAQSILRNSVILKSREKVGHIHYFTKDLALSVLKDTGYKVLDHFYIGSSIDAPALSWKARVMKVPRKLFFAINKDVAVRVLGGYSLLVLAH